MDIFKKLRADQDAKEKERQKGLRGLPLLNHWFWGGPDNAPEPKRKHAKHDRRWRRRKIAKASRQRNRR